MCCYSAPPGYVQSKQLERPKLRSLIPVIDTIPEADKTAPPKHGIRRSGFSNGCGSNMATPAATRW